MLEYNRGIEEGLNNICAPLIDNLGMNFCYVKKYKTNKQFVVISNQSLLSELFCLGPDSMHAVHAKQLPILFSDFKFALWTSCVSFKDNTLSSRYTKALWNHGCKVGLSVIRQNNAIEEVWSFIPINYIKDFDFFCIRNIEVFTRFIKHFNNKANSIINTNTNKLTLLGYNTVIDYNSKDSMLTDEKERVNSFIDAIGMTVKVKDGNIVTMSKQEIKFLRLLSEGRNIKEIASALSIAHKTSENHMYKIKIKTGYTLKSDLVKLYLDQGN